MANTPETPWAQDGSYRSFRAQKLTPLQDIEIPVLFPKPVYIELGDNVLQLSRLLLNGPENKLGVPPQQYSLHNLAGDPTHDSIAFGNGTNRIIVGRETTPQLSLDRTAAPRHFTIEQAFYRRVISISDFASETGVTIHMAGNPLNLGLT